MFCFHWWLTIHQWTEFSISTSTYVQISCVKYIPLLCRIWPDFIQKSSLFYQQSLGMIQTHVPNFLDDKIRATVQLITYTVPQNCLSLSTIHHNSQFTFKTVLPLSNLVQRLSFRFFSKGCHLSKIRFGANVTIWKQLYLSVVLCCRVLFLSSFTVVVELSKSTTCLHFHSFIYSKYDVIKRFTITSITLNYSLSDLIISSQRLITISVSLCTQTVLPCLILQVLNTRVWFLKAWYNHFHFCT